VKRDEVPDVPNMPEPGPPNEACRHIEVQHRHGTLQCYASDSCRCGLCREAHQIRRARIDAGLPVRPAASIPRRRPGRSRPATPLGKIRCIVCDRPLRDHKIGECLALPGGGVQVSPTGTYSPSSHPAEIR